METENKGSSSAGIESGAREEVAVKKTMETENKGSSSAGIESGAREEVAVANQRKIAVANRRKMRGCDAVLRLLALALSLAAAVVLGVDKETTTVALTLVPALPPLDVSVTGKWQYLSAFVFFLVANAIASGAAAISLLLALVNKDRRKGITLMILLLDLAMVALLFSSVGAALAVGLIGYKGNSHVQWNKVCDNFGKFCDQGAVAMGLSGGAALVFFLLVVLATFNLHKKH